MADDNSRTWSAHLRILCMKYNIPNPLELLNEGVWNKSRWTTLVKTRITVYFETLLRQKATLNSKMKYLNVQVQGLSGVPHPALLNIITTQDALKLRHHLKLLSRDFLTAERMALDTGSNPQCKLCSASVESTEHVVTMCRATADIRGRLLPELLNTVLSVQPNCLIINSQSQHLAQFVLDCTSLNLPAAYRIAAHNPRVSDVFRISRHWCFAISKARARILKQLYK
jgi:hypothetical protein